MQKKRYCVTSEVMTQKVIQLPSGSFPLGTLTVGSQPLYFEEFQATQRGHSQVIWLTVFAKSQLVAIINLQAREWTDFRRLQTPAFHSIFQLRLQTFGSVTSHFSCALTNSCSNLLFKFLTQRNCNKWLFIPLNWGKSFTQ